MRITAAAVHRLAEEPILHRLSNRKKENVRRRFVSSFGLNPHVVAMIWNRLDDKDLLPKDMMVKHLLWALLFLKTYQPTGDSAPRCGADEKTYRKWVWIALDALGEMDLVRHCICDLSSCTIIMYVLAHFAN